MIAGFIVGFVDRDTNGSTVLVGGRFSRDGELVVGYGLFVDGWCLDVIPGLEAGRSEVMRRARQYDSAHRVIEVGTHTTGKLEIAQASRYRFSFKTKQEEVS